MALLMMAHHTAAPGKYNYELDAPYLLEVEVSGTQFEGIRARAVPGGWCVCSV